MTFTNAIGRQTKLRPRTHQDHSVCSALRIKRKHQLPVGLHRSGGEICTMVPAKAVRRPDETLHPSPVQLKADPVMPFLLPVERGLV